MIAQLVGDETATTRSTLAPRAAIPPAKSEMPDETELANAKGSAMTVPDGRFTIGTFLLSSDATEQNNR